MKVWITKYALKDGITKENAEQNDWLKEYGAVSVERFCHAFILGRDAFEDRNSAIAKAEEMRMKKIASLKKQIAKLEALKFDAPEEA